jgi:hypothetical protein
LAGVPSVQVLCGAIPEALPDGSFDLVVASEILYYLEPGELAATLARLRDVVARHGRLVAVHWRPSGDERPFTAAEVHALVRRQGWLSPVLSAPTDDYLLDVLERQ